MYQGPVRVLLVQDSAFHSSHLSLWLEKRGCQCYFADSLKDAANLVVQKPFDLVLSVIRPHPGAISALGNLLEGTPAHFFHAHPVEDGCWWLPAIRAGQLSHCSPALRPIEFTDVLERLIRQIQQERAPSPRGPQGGAPKVGTSLKQS